MKKVLMVAHQFPPVGGSGVQRTVKFVKYLRNFEWEPVVFTRATGRMSLKDETLFKDIPKGIKIIRSAAFDFSEFPGILGIPGKILNRKILIPDGEFLWQFFGRHKAYSEVRDSHTDLIYTTSYPYSDHLLGLYLKRKFPGIPWVADFRDEWTKNPNIIDYKYGKFRTDVEKKLESEVLYNADRVIANTPFMMENFLIDRNELRDKFDVIPNGYDEEDFRNLSFKPPKNKRFTITYAGLLYGRRKPDRFFEAAGKLLSQKGIPKNRFRIRLIGNFKMQHLFNLLSKNGLEDVAEVLPYMKHHESIRQLLKSDALLLVAGEGEEAFYLGKIFEYMYTGRPILAVVPERGAAADLIRNSGTGLVAETTDTNAIAENLLRLYNSWNADEPVINPVADEITRYERKKITEQLAFTFDKALK